MIDFVVHELDNVLLHLLISLVRKFITILHGGSSPLGRTWSEVRADMVVRGQILNK